MKISQYVNEGKIRTLKVYRGTQEEINGWNELTNDTYFTTDLDIAWEFAEDEPGKGYIVEAKIKVNNTYVAKDEEEILSMPYDKNYIERLKQKGYDSIQGIGNFNSYWVVFDKNNIEFISCWPLSYYIKNFGPRNKEEWNEDI